ncbi:MAG: succinate dehydrogenase/fumarate reductase iron-sulfur subunit, partial [Phormidesmis sp.]
MKINLRVWRQANPQADGSFENYAVEGVQSDLSFLEVLDMLNEQLTAKGEVPVEFDHDCREGICGSCGMMVDGQAHGPQQKTAVCQLYMRNFQDGDTVTLEPWRAKAFPVIKDLVVDRSAFDRISAAGGYISVRTGAAPEANAMLVPKPDADKAFD